MAPDVTVEDIAEMIDHAILKPELTREQVDAELELAARHAIFSVCVRPCDVAHAVARLEATEVVIGTVIGFPHGTTSTAAKVAESRQAMDDGVAELDMVLNIGLLRSGLFEEVESDIRAVVEAADDRVVKVILETALLDDDQIVAGCEAAERAGARFVKTSTGFAEGGATIEHVRLMRSSVSAAVEIKASGGVRSLGTLLEMLEAGATRFGTSATAIILDDLAGRVGGAASAGASSY